MCGFVGMVSSGHVAHEIHMSLQALQHRGQDSAGIAVMDRRGMRFNARRGLGKAADALGAEDLHALPGPAGVGHVRYPTIGGGGLEDTQPFFYRQPGILMAHNGNLTNYEELKDGLKARSIHLLSHCDVEPALCELADGLMQCRASGHTVEDAVQAATLMQQRVRGSYSIVAVALLDDAPTLMVLRDPNGLRPAVIGSRNGAWIAASESVALDVLGFERTFEPGPGELVLLREGEAPIRRHLTPPMPAPCVFEHVYFARPDSEIEGRSVYEIRLSLGRELATRVKEKDIEADVVIPVPDTARPAAVSMAESLGLPQREGLIKNRYSGRTFIMPSAGARDSALRLKLNTLPREIRGRRVLLVDDSIVRGTTLKRVIQLVRDAGAEAVHLAIHSPPVKHPCFYGIDMSTEEELFARRFGESSLEDLELLAAESLGADSLTYLSVGGLDRAFGGARCAACFDGRYPQAVSDLDRAQIAEDRRDQRRMLLTAQ